MIMASLDTFQIDLAVLKAAITKFTENIDSMMLASAAFLNVNDNLTISGWTGKSSKSFQLKNGKCRDDFASQLANLRSLRDALNKFLTRAATTQAKAVAIGKVFGCPMDASRGRIGLSRSKAVSASSDAAAIAKKLEDSYWKLEEIKTLANSLETTSRITSKMANSRQKTISNEQEKMHRFITALLNYSNDVNLLEAIMKGWKKPKDMKAWTDFTMAYFKAAGMKPGDIEALLADKNALSVIIAVMLGVNYNCYYGGDPVNMSTGNFVYQREYLSSKGYFPFSFLMTYNSREEREGALGSGWTHAFEVSAQRQDNQITLILEDGQRTIFEKDDQGVWRHFQKENASLTEKEDGCLLYRTHTGLNYIFDAEGKLDQIIDRNDHYLKFFYSESGQLETVVNDSEAHFDFSYEKGRLTQVVDNTGRTLSFAYSEGLLTSSADEEGNTYTYTYNKVGKIIQVTNPLGIAAVENEYDDQGRVISQKMADGGKTTSVYDDDTKSVTFTEQNGNEITYVHDDRYRSVQTIYADGTETSVYDDQNQLTSYTDKLGNRASYKYDERGNQIGFTNALGEVFTTSYNELNCPTEVIVCGIPQLKALYDERGNATELYDALGRTTKAKRDKTGLPTEVTLPDLSKIKLTYDKRGNPLSVTDPSGTTIFEYDERSQPTAAIDPLGNKTTFAYNAKGDLAEIINAAGGRRTYAYNALGRPVKITDFDGSIIQYGYHIGGRPKTFTDQEGNTTTLEYDLMGNAICRTDAEGFSTHTEYDQFNRPIKVTDEEGITVECYEYDAAGNRTKITGPRGEETHISYDALSRPIEVTEPDGAKTSATYNELGSITCIADALGHKYLRDYDLAGQLIKATDPTGAVSIFSYTLLGQLASVTGPAGLMTIYDYLPGGLLKKVTYPDGRYQAYNYDAAKNLTSRTDQDGYTLTYCYDCLNRITQISTSTGQTTTYSYDSAGRVVSVTDAQGNTTCYSWSPTGKLISATDPIGTRTEYAYDKRGLIASVKQLSDLFEANELNAQNLQVRLTTYKRTAQGRITEITDALGATEAYSYNAAGQPVTKLDKDGYLTKFDYDITGQLAQVDYADGKQAAYSYNVLRQLTQIKDWIGTTTIDVDEIGRATRVTDPAGRQVSYAFGPSGERTNIAYPGGRQVAYSYDEALRLASLDDGDTHIDYNYDSSSRLTEKLFNNGTAASYSYNETGLLAELVHTDSQGILDSLNYNYDSLLRKSSIETFRRGMPEASGEYAYSYDALSHLTEVSKDGKLQKAYGYDAYGNRSFTTEPAGRTDYHYNQLNQLIHLEGSEAVKDLIYDKRGNLIQTLTDGVLSRSYEYGPLNRLTSVTDAAGKSASYLYNGLGSRIGQQIEDGLNPTKCIDYLLDLTQQYNNVLQIDDGASTKDYLWDGMIAAEASEAEARTYLHDDLGSPLRFMGADGLPLDSYLYDEFGADLSVNQGVSQPFGYTGYSFDGIADSYFAQARQYDSASGRFAGPDTHWNTFSMIYGDSILFLPDTDAIKQNGNLYAYCMSDPLQYVDRLGEWGGEIHSGDPTGKKWQSPTQLLPQLNQTSTHNKNYNGTFQWALEVIVPKGQTPTAAQVAMAKSIANADNYIDDPQGSSHALPGGQPKLHFNREDTVVCLVVGWSDCDTRITAAHQDLMGALAVAPQDAAFEDYIGKGLHSLQDIFAHGNKGVVGSDTSVEGAVSGFVASHLLTKHIDDPTYDWSDCSLTKVRPVTDKNGKAVTGQRYKSTELATKAYIAGALSEAGK